MAVKEKSYRGFTYSYDLGKVKVAKPIPKKMGKIARKWLDKFDLSKVELMLIGKDRYDPLSSGSAFSLCKGEEVLSTSNLDRIRQRDFDFVCIMMENDADGNLFKNRDKMERIVLGELVHIAYPETIGNRHKTDNMVAEILESTS